MVRPVRRAADRPGRLTTVGTAGTRDEHYDERLRHGYVDDDLEAEDLPAAREPEPLPVAPAIARPGRWASPRRGRIRRCPARVARGSAPMGSGPVGATAREARRPGVGRARVAPTPAPAPAPQPYRITTLHPRTYNEARTIGERFRDGMPVIMNLTEMDDADANRLVDFAAGLSFGLRGSIERVTAKVFLLSPQTST